MKPILYIDFDDTLVAQCIPGSGFDLRPGVMTQLRILSNLFEIRWLTCCDEERMEWFARVLYLPAKATYQNWGHGHPDGKAGAVLAPDAPKDFYWLEDGLCKNELAALKRAGQLHRYVRVAGQGHWGFLDAIKILLKRTGWTYKKLQAKDISPTFLNNKSYV